MHNDFNAKTPSTQVALSVVIPLFNDEAVLTRLFDRLYPLLDGLGQTYEAVFVDDGSRDRSATLLRQQYKLRPDTTRVVQLRSTVGPHAATLAGFAACVGRRIVTLDAHLQASPEEIPRLLAEMERGHDYVASVRRRGPGPNWRDSASRFANRVRERITGIHMTDQDCTLQAYDREIVDAVLTCNAGYPFIPALAYRYAANPTEVPIEHEDRAAGDSRYPFYKLTQLNLGLMTGFSLIPLRTFSLVGIGISIASFGFVIYLALRWLIVGPAADGLFALFGLLFFLAGVILFGIGLLGEYVGHIFEQTLGRSRYLVREELSPRLAGRRPKA
jgi:undecaprenyl-phosphate 4-deoxy-4-formamido-L-arabinose transferase